MAPSQLTLFFADICHSTQLYDQYGDVVAKEKISEALKKVSSVVIENQGVVVKTIGDEILARFASAENASQAARELQQLFQLHGSTQMDEIPILLRIGFHYGSAILEEDDIFGDAVNVASRVVAIAKPGQSLTTRATIDSIPFINQIACRQIDRVLLKGKTQPMDIFEIHRDEEDVTRINRGVNKDQLNQASLLIYYRNQEILITSIHPQYTLGRGKHNNLIIEEDLASRQHITFETRRGKYYIIDKSTNGTYIRNQKNEEIYLRREELQLPTEGSISVGKSFSEEPTEVIRFRIISNNS